MTATMRTYGCAHCDATFSNPVTLGGHVHAQHPEHKRPVSVARPWIPRRGPRPDGSLKRDTDTWPGKP